METHLSTTHPSVDHLSPALLVTNHLGVTPLQLQTNHPSLTSTTLQSTSQRMLVHVLLSPNLEDQTTAISSNNLKHYEADAAPSQSRDYPVYYSCPQPQPQQPTDYQS